MYECYGHGIRKMAIEIYSHGGLPLDFYLSLNMRRQQRCSFRGADHCEDFVMSNIRDLRLGRKYSSLKHCD